MIPSSYLQPNVETGRWDFSFRFWGVVLLTGAGTGLAAGLLMRLLFAVERFAWPYGDAAINFVRSVGSAPAYRRILFLLLAGIIVAIGRKLLQLRKTGGHAAEVTEAIWLGGGRMSLFDTAAKGVLSIVVVGIGASLGREGAVKQMGAAWAARLGEWCGFTDPQRRLLMACGAGAGIAAAYNVPFGGAIFAMEVLLGTLAIPQVLPALMTSLIATAVSWLFLPNAPVYPIAVHRLSASDILWAAVAGPVMGLAAVSYIRTIAWADARRPSGGGKALAPIVVLGLLGIAAVWMPQLLGNGRDVVRDTYALSFAMPFLLILALGRFAATTASLGSGVPGGLFTPTLACGTLLAGFFGSFGAALAPQVDVLSCAVVGGGAFLAAATEGPVSAVVLMLELTRSIGALVVPLLLAVTGALLVSRALETRSIYSARVKAPPPPSPPRA